MPWDAVAGKTIELPCASITRAFTLAFTLAFMLALALVYCCVTVFRASAATDLCHHRRYRCHNVLPLLHLHLSYVAGCVAPCTHVCNRGCAVLLLGGARLSPAVEAFHTIYDLHGRGGGHLSVLNARGCVPVNLCQHGRPDQWQIKNYHTKCQLDRSTGNLVCGEVADFEGRRREGAKTCVCGPDTTHLPTHQPCGPCLAVPTGGAMLNTSSHPWEGRAGYA